jgi:hypothetical protein
MRTNLHFWSYLAALFLEFEILGQKLWRKSKHTFLCPVTFFENRAFYETMWKNMK